MVALANRLKRFFKTTAPRAQKSFYTQFGNTFSRSYMVMPGQPVWMDRRYEQFACEAYIRNVIAHRAVDMIASSAATVWFKLYETNTRGTRREIKNHASLNLLTRPNPLASYCEFFQALYHYLLIGGNAYVQSVGPTGGVPTELHLLRPDRMTIIAGKGTLPAAYRYTVNDKSKDFPVDSITGASRILHLKNFHPLNDWYGLSAVEAAAYSIDQHNYAGAWNQSLLQNGARPSGALVVRPDTGGGVLSEEQYQRVKNQIDEQFAGAANAGRPLLLEGGLDWRELSLSPKDMDFIEMKHSAARDIALAFGVPPQLIGIPGDNTYSNLQEARFALWEQTVLPLAERTADAFSRWLLPFFSNQLEFAPDSDNLPALALRNQVIWDRVQGVDFLTEDEKRAAVGYGPMPKPEPELPMPMDVFNPAPPTSDMPAKYSASQPRDDDGKWTDGGGGSSGSENNKPSSNSSNKKPSGTQSSGSGVKPVAKPAKELSISDEGIQAIAKHESFSATVYKDPKGIETIGYGHVVLPGESFPKEGISHEEALSIYKQDREIAARAVRNKVKVPLTQNQFDALTSLVYNIGGGKDGFGGSIVLHLLNRGDYRGAARHFADWNKITDDKTGKKIRNEGLTRRRRREMELFLKDVEP